MEEGGNVVHCIHRGKGDAILFIHGMPTNRMLWDGIIQQLASHHRCFAVDLPGMEKRLSFRIAPVILIAWQNKLSSFACSTV